MSVAIGRAVRTARRGAGLSQSELAERMGSAQAHVSRLERGATPWSAAQVLRAAQALGLAVEALYPSAGHAGPQESEIEAAG